MRPVAPPTLGRQNLALPRFFDSAVLVADVGIADKRPPKP